MREMYVYWDRCKRQKVVLLLILISLFFLGAYLTEAPEVWL